MLQASTPAEFLNSTTIFTFGGATLGVFALSIAARKALRINHTTVPLFIAVLFSFALAFFQHTLHDIGWVVATVNGCLLWLAVVGMNETATDAATKKPEGGGEKQGKKKRPRLPALASFYHVPTDRPANPT